MQPREGQFDSSVTRP
nr:unnamed protein product [Callosobruchus chinensis]CAH7757664.1 unnamed protein product [Callosobruchus chinensis]